MLVECPSCHTKFAIETGQIGSKKSAHFHCSRCDHYFEAKPLLVENKIPKEALSKKEEKKQLSFIKKSEKLTLDFSKPFKNQGKKKGKNPWTIEKKDEAFQISLDLGKQGPQIIGGKKALTTICTLPICFTLFIGSISWQVDKMPSLFQKVFLLESTGLEQIPPAGVELAEISLQESPGEGVEIRGNIMNTTSNSFVDAKIKTTFFDKHNAKLDEVITTHAVLLETNTKNNFVVNLDKLPKKSAWFSSAIYSVKRVPL